MTVGAVPSVDLDDVVGGDTTADRAGGDGAADRRGRRGAGQRWARWVHVYASMISLVLVLFFGVTGLTLNHPDWTFGDEATTATVQGTLTSTDPGTASVDFLAVSEELRSKHGISAAVSDHRLEGTQGSISYRSPGYAADVTFATDTGAYTLVVEQQGVVAVMNDLHKGRDADSSWKWLIDAAAALLVAIAASGLLLQLYLRRRRRSALVAAGVGSVLMVLLAAVTL